MEYKLNIAVDTDGIIFNLFLYQLIKGLEKFTEIDKNIIINSQCFSDLDNMSQEEKTQFLIKYIEIYSTKNSKKININEYDIQNIFNIEPTFIEKKIAENNSRNEKISYEEALEKTLKKYKIKRNLFWIKEIINYCIKSEVIDKSLENIKKWQRQGHSVGNITARVFVTEDNIVGLIFRTILEGIYDKIDLKFDYIDYCSEKNSPLEKKLACNKRAVDVMIEDKLDNANIISEIGMTEVLLYNYPYNVGNVNKRIKRVNNYDEIDDFIQNIVKERSSSLKNNTFIYNDTLITPASEQLSNMSKLELWDYKKQVRNYYENVDMSIMQYNGVPYKEVYDTLKIKKHERTYKIIYPLIQGTFNIIFNPKILGKKNIPYQRGTIFVSNHLTYVDQFLIAKALGNRPVHFLAAKVLQEKSRWKLYENIGCLSVDNKNKKSHTRKISFEILQKLVSSGHDVVIFPEGTRNNGRYEIDSEKRYNEELLKYANGACRISQNTGAPICRMTINSNYNLIDHFFGAKLINEVSKPICIMPWDDIDKENTSLMEETTASIIKIRELQKQKKKQKGIK